jgi:hypothetical protein
MGGLTAAVRVRFAAALLAGLVAAPIVARAQSGIASRYPRDAGIATDPHVLKVENFEISNLQTLTTRWTDVKNVAGMSLTSDKPPASAGTRALKITGVGGSNDGGHLFAPLPQGQKRLFVRYYVKYASNHTYHHSSAWIGGYNPSTSWPQGGAGTRPSGNDRFSVGFEPVDPNLSYDFYAYWMRMHISGDGMYWGNHLINDQSLRAPLQWTCVEVMVQLNDPVGSYNGELAVWINGDQITHLGPGYPNGIWGGGGFHADPAGAPFEGFQWRNDQNLLINWIWLEHYVTDEPAGSVSPIWYDDVVVATEYIGPISLPEPGATAQLGAGVLALLALRARSRGALTVRG